MFQIIGDQQERKKRVADTSPLEMWIGLPPAN